MTGTLPHRLRSSTSLFLMFLLLVALADFFFYGHTVGWTLGAYAGALLFALLLRGSRAMRTGGGALLLAGVVGLALAAAEHPGTLVVLLLLLGVVSLAMVGRGGWTSSISAWFARWAGFAAAGWTRWFTDQRAQRKRARRVRGRPSLALRLVRQWAIPAALGMVFAIIFIVANPVIAMLAESAKTFIGDTLARIPDLLAPTRILFWAFVGVWVWALLRMRTRRARAATEALPEADMALDEWISPALVVRCLLVFNAVFALETILDARYMLLGGGLPEGMSIQSYVHRGAYPLVAASLLAACFVVVTFRHNGPAQRSPVARKLVYLWLAQNTLLVLSAAWRLWLYVDAYGLTRWRFAALLWMVLVAVGLALIVHRIVRCRSNAWLLRANSLSALLMIYTCAPIDIDGLISMFNVHHCREVSKDSDIPLDVEYLRAQGVAALPALEWVAGELETRGEFKAAKAKMYRDELRDEVRREMLDWRGWTWRRQRALATIPAEALAVPLRERPTEVETSRRESTWRDSASRDSTSRESRRTETQQQSFSGELE
ncbi:MAG: DUF4173 domain-containing protein [Planctomycetota bacterium]|nr:DUF4173 domain-containing protein [Planctomycetota bacterium]